MNTPHLHKYAVEQLKNKHPDADSIQIIRIEFTDKSALVFAKIWKSTPEIIYTEEV